MVCIHVVPLLYAVAITMSDSLTSIASQTFESKWCDSYVSRLFGQHPRCRGVVLPPISKAVVVVVLGKERAFWVCCAGDDGVTSTRRIKAHKTKRCSLFLPFLSSCGPNYSTCLKTLNPTCFEFLLGGNKKLGTFFPCDFIDLNGQTAGTFVGWKKRHGR